jgi:tRNA threonylcarbamoyl adenosine modification protein YeaZ
MKPSGGLFMKILAIDFSSDERSVAAWNDGVGSEILEKGTRTTDALGLMEAALRDARLEREQVEAVVVGLGPGSYTGIRAAIALAQGWQLARGVKLLGISSAAAIAVQAQITGMRGAVTLVIDAQRGEFYSATYDLTDDHADEIVKLKIVSADELRAKAATGETLIGPEVTRWFPGGTIICSRAKTLARMAANGGYEFVSGEKLEPIYLREAAFIKAPPARVIG